MKKIVALDGKYSLAAFRLIILFLMAFFMLYGKGEILGSPQMAGELFWWMTTLASIHLASNIALLFLPERIVKHGLTTGFFFLDTTLISIALYKTQGLQNDLFLIYFLVVFMTVVSRKPKLSFLVAGLACLLYGTLFLKTNSAHQLFQPDVLIRFPLLLVVAFFSSIIVQETEKSELKALETLSQMSRDIFSKLKMENLLPSLAELISKVVQADDAAILLADKDRLFFVAASFGRDEKIKDSFRLEIVKKCKNISNCHQIISLNSHDPQIKFFNEKMDIRSLFIYPLLTKDNPIGALVCLRTINPHPFSPHEEHIANVYGSLISQSIDNARLYKELENKIASLNHAYSKLSLMQSELIQAEKLSAIGQLAAGVAHELNNPLTSVLGLVDILLTDGNLTNSMREDLKIVKEEASQCSVIITDLLRFARKHPSQKEVTSINNSVEQTLHLVQHELKSSGINLVTDLDRSNPTARADPNQLQQVLLNLVNNAVDALKGQSDPQLTIRTRKTDHRVKIEIADNGCGILQSDIGRIFEPFFTTKEVGKGTGLGLSISYGIIKDHGGDIEVKSMEGKGTSFVIDLAYTSKETIAFAHAA